jgi:hypothetical protein
MSPVGFEPTISAGERPQIYALDRAATGTGTAIILCLLNSITANIQVTEGGTVNSPRLNEDMI